MAMQLVANNLQLATSKVRIALEKYGKPVPGINDETEKTQITINLSNCPREFLQHLLTTDLTDGQRRAVAIMVKLLKTLYGGSPVTEDQVMQTIQFTVDLSGT